MRASLLVLIVSAVAVGNLGAAPDCGTMAVLAGCVGDNVIDPTCADRYEATHTVTADDVDASPGNVARFCLVTVDTSLCGNTSAIATVTRSGAGPRTTDLNDGGEIRLNAKEGDEIRVVVEQVPRNNGIECFRQGDIHFELAR